MRTYVLCLFCTLLISPAALAQIFGSSKNPSETLPSVIVNGLEIYKTSSPEAAIQIWSKGGPLEGNKEVFSQAAFLQQIQESYGGFQGYEIVGKQTLSRRTQVFFLAMHYAKGPVFAKFVSYKTADGWILSSFQFSKEDTILPSPPANQ